MKAKEKQEDFNMKLMQISWTKLKKSWIRRVAPTNQEATRPLSKKEDPGVVANITITPKDIQKEST
jgi:hypothetical protein